MEQFFTAAVLVQVTHAVEELATGFHKKWYLFQMPFWGFLTWEIIFIAFWVFVLLSETMPYREELRLFFLVLMFANGVQHLVWAGVIKQYVPGLLTAPMHILVFLLFCFSVIRPI